MNLSHNELKDLKRIKQIESLCRRLVRASENLTAVAENITIADTQFMRDKLARAISEVHNALEAVRKILGESHEYVNNRGRDG